MHGYVPENALGKNNEEVMPFPDELGVICCRCVLEKSAAVLFVSHAGNDWQMYCSDRNHDFNDEVAMRHDLRVVHMAHLIARDPTLNEISNLPVDMGAERDAIGAAWTTFDDRD